MILISYRSGKTLSESLVGYQVFFTLIASESAQFRPGTITWKNVKLHLRRIIAKVQSTLKTS